MSLKRRRPLTTIAARTYKRQVRSPSIGDSRHARHGEVRLRAILHAGVSVIILSACTTNSMAPSSAPTITIAQPLTGPVGTGVTITGNHFSDTTNTINFGVSAFVNIPSSNGTIVFVVPMQTNPPCRNATPPCEITTALITPGDYALSITTSQGTSASVTFTVTKF